MIKFFALNSIFVSEVVVKRYVGKSIHARKEDACSKAFVKGY
jgi:hypothetical protein